MKTIDDMLTFAYSNQAYDNPLKGYVITLAAEILLMRKKEEALIEALEGMIELAEEFVDDYEKGSRVIKAFAAIKLVKNK